MTPPAVPAEERLLNLLLALRHSAGGMTALEILHGVTGYDARADEASRRMLERDKGVLRELGIEITVVGTGEESRYRVLDDDYVLPPLHLSAAQAAAVDLAASAWRSGELTAAARHARTKTRAIADLGEEALVPGLTVDLAGEQVPAELATAVSERRRVAFDYAPARSGPPRSRTVEPHRLYVSEGAWYLDALDVTRGSERTFRLSRIRGTVSAVSGPSAFPPAARPREEVLVARIACAPGHALGLRAAGRILAEVPPTAAVPSGWDVVEAGYRQTESFAGSLAALGDAVLVLDPPALRSLVLAHLEGAARLDSGLPDVPEVG